MQKISKYSKWIVAAIILLNTLFAAAVIYAHMRGATIPDSLIYSWFGSFTGELWIISGITKAKIKEGNVNADNRNESGF